MTGTSVAVFGVTDTGVVRTNNEDAFALVDLTGDVLVDVARGQAVVELGPRGMAIILSDGMGGQQAGEVASALVVQSVREVLAGALGAEEDPSALRLAVEHANRQVIHAAQAPTMRGMGATCTALLISETDVVTAEVGDSRAYVLRSGKLSPITKDQTYLQLLVDRGAITPESIGRSAAKNVLLQAIGRNSELVVAQRRLALRRGDRLLVCSDGLFGELADADIQTAILRAESLQGAASRLILMAKNRGGRDNITVVLAAVTGPALPEAAPGETVEATLQTIRPFLVGTPPM